MTYLLLCWRFTKHAFVYLVFCLPLILLGMLVLAVVLPFIPAGKETLPKALAWFDNYGGRTRGYPAGDGLSGDPIYRLYRMAEGHTSLLWERYYWLALRNPINHFSYTVLGHLYELGDHVTYHKGALNPNTAMDGGWKILELETTKDQFAVIGAPFTPQQLLQFKKVLYEYQYVTSYTLFGRKLCLWFRFGWKIENQGYVRIGEIAEWVFTLNPFKPQ